MKEITRGGLVTIEFSKALAVPRDLELEPNFQDVTSPEIFAKFQKNSINDDEILFTFEPIEFDLEGRWCTF